MILLGFHFVCVRVGDLCFRYYFHFAHIRVCQCCCIHRSLCWYVLSKQWDPCVEKMPNDRSSIYTHLSNVISEHYYLFFTLSAYALRCFVAVAIAIAAAIAAVRCCCNFCVSARDIFLYARDSATTFEECINIHIICVCQWTKVLVIIRPLIMTHWLSHTPHNTQRRQRQRKIHFFLAHILQHLFVIRFQRK